MITATIDTLYMYNDLDCLFNCNAKTSEAQSVQTYVGYEEEVFIQIPSCYNQRKLLINNHMLRLYS